jgi:pimeloyl-ACP methyl ester carboxylesterase
MPAMKSPRIVVLIHGGQVGAWVWDSVREFLIVPSFAPDLPAHGDRAGQLKGLRIAECVDTVFEEIPAGGCVMLVGHSLGAAIALALANRLHERLDHVVLIGGIVPIPGAPAVSSFPFAMRIACKALLRFTHQFSQPVGVIKATLLNGIPAALADDAAAKFTSESTSLLFDPVDWSPMTATPATYVRCLRDRGVLSPTHQQRLAARLGPRASVVSLDACHYAMLEKPGEVAAIINSIAI